MLIGEETLNTTAYCQVDERDCHVMVEHLSSRYALIGQSAPATQAVKRLRLAVIAAPLQPSGDYNFRVYCVADNSDELEVCSSENIILYLMYEQSYLFCFFPCVTLLLASSTSP